MFNDEKNMIPQENEWEEGAQDMPEGEFRREEPDHSHGFGPGEHHHPPKGPCHGGHGPHGEGHGPCRKGEGFEGHGCCHKGPGPHGPGHHHHPLPDDDSLPSLVHKCMFLIRHGGPAAGQGRVLQLLRQEESLPQRELLLRLGIRPGSLSELIGKLEAKGLIERERDDQDRRKATVRITPAGRAAAEESQAEADPFAVLTEEEQDALRALLTKVLDGNM